MYTCSLMAWGLGKKVKPSALKKKYLRQTNEAQMASSFDVAGSSMLCWHVQNQKKHPDNET